MKVRIATRKSPLALAQTRWIAAELKRHHPGVEVEELHIVTKGDRILDKPLAEIGGKGLFVTEIENAILEGTADLAVHSFLVGIADAVGSQAATEIDRREPLREHLDRVSSLTAKSD